MRRSVLLLCFCLIVAAFDVPLTGIVSTFAEELMFGNQSETKPIRHPSVPFMHEGVLYYWKGFYQGAASTPKRCVFNANREEWPFGNVTFANGSSPTGVEYGCAINARCNKLRCEKSLPAGFFWGISLLVSAVIAFIVYARYWIARHGQSRDDQDIELRSVYSPATATGRERHIASGGPPYIPL